MSQRPQIHLRQPNPLAGPRSPVQRSASKQRRQQRVAVRHGHQVTELVGARIEYPRSTTDGLPALAPLKCASATTIPASRRSLATSNKRLRSAADDLHFLHAQPTSALFPCSTTPSASTCWRICLTTLPKAALPSTGALSPSLRSRYPARLRHLPGCLIPASIHSFPCCRCREPGLPGTRPESLPCAPRPAVTSPRFCSFRCASTRGLTDASDLVPSYVCYIPASVPAPDGRHHGFRLRRRARISEQPGPRPT